MFKLIGRLFCILSLTIGLTSNALAEIPPLPPIIGTVILPPSGPPDNPENPPTVCIGCATTATTAVPLPATSSLLGLGLAAVGYSRRRRKKHV